MTLSTFTWLTIGAILVYMVSVDANVYEWLILQSKNVGIQARRIWFLFRHNPNSPWVRWEIDRTAKSIAAELLKEQQNK